MKKRGISGVFKEITHVIRFGVRHHFQNRVKQRIFSCLVIGYWSGSFKYSRRVFCVILPFWYPIILCIYAIFGWKSTNLTFISCFVKEMN